MIQLVIVHVTLVNSVIFIVKAVVIRDVTVVTVFVMDVIRGVMLVHTHGLVIHVIVTVIIVMVATSIVIMDNQTHAQIVMKVVILVILVSHVTLCAKLVMVASHVILNVIAQTLVINAILHATQRAILIVRNVMVIAILRVTDVMDFVTGLVMDVMNVTNVI